MNSGYGRSFGQPPEAVYCSTEVLKSFTQFGYEEQIICGAFYLYPGS